jgi:flagellin-specific chaperone FliS
MLTENRPLAGDSQVRADLRQAVCPNLIETALRSARRAHKLLCDFDFDGALESLVAARQSISRLIAEIPTDDLPASQEVEGKYVHLLSMLIEAQQTCDAHQLGEVIGILEEEFARGQRTSEKPSVSHVPPPNASFAARGELKSSIVSKRSPLALDA